MVASPKIHCTVLKFPVATDQRSLRGTQRPSDLVPWADPYIARLVAKLQAEVRAERGRRDGNRLRVIAHVQSEPWPMPADLYDDLEVPWLDQFEYEPDTDDDRHEDDGGCSGDLSVVR